MTFPAPCIGRLTDYTKNRKYIGTGQWRVKDNEICTHADWRRPGEAKHTVFNNCAAWFRHGREYWTRITKGANRGEVYKGNASLVSNGDHVSGVVCAMNRADCR